MTFDNSSSQSETPELDQKLRDAVAHHQSGELQRAEELYKAVLQANSRHPIANHNLGALYVQTQQPAAALAYLMAALEADPAHGQYWLSYIDALMHAGQMDAAREVLALAKQQGLQGDEVDTLELRLHGGEQMKSAAPSGSARQQGRFPSDKEYGELLTMFNQGLFDAAIIRARAMTKNFPFYSFGWKVMGAALNQLGRNAEALRPMQKAVELDPEDAETHKNLGIALKDMGRLNEAESSYRRALQIKPDFAEVQNNLGIVLQDMGRLNEAESSYRRALQIKPDFAEVHNNLGTILQEMGRLSEAEASCRQALKIKPDFANAHGNLGTILQAMGRMDEALACFQQRARLTPGNAVDQHLIASLTGTNTERAPIKYVEEVFDSYAVNFDAHLQHGLQYDIPEKLLVLITQHLSHAGKWDVLDLGCGTGLIGVQISPFSRQLVGVDLSAKMLGKARERKLYQRLVKSDLLPMMQNEQASSFDVIVAADVFIYIGRVDEVIAEINRLLRPGGVFAFSVENCDPSSNGDQYEYQLKNSGRYGQSGKYLTQLALANGLLIEEMIATQIRTEHGRPIEGHIGLWRKEKLPG